MFLIWHLEGKAESFDFFINDFEMWCLQLPSTQLENVLTKHTNLRTPLASYVINKNIHPTLPRSVVLAVFLNVFSFNDLWSFLLCLKLLFTHKNGGMFEFLVPYKKKDEFLGKSGILVSPSLTLSFFIQPNTKGARSSKWVGTNNDKTIWFRCINSRCNTYVIYTCP